MFRGLALLILSSLALSGCTAGKIEQPKKAAHVPLEATAGEIQNLMAQDPELSKSPETIRATQEVKDILEMGARNYQWLEMINAQRPEGSKLSFSNATSTRGIPIDEPDFYNAEIIQKKFESLRQELPPAMNAVLSGSEPVPSTLPAIEETEYLKFGLKVSKLYDLATRWVLMSNQIPYLKVAQAEDIRGYIFLKNLENVEEKLENFETLEPALQQQIREALVRLCLNNADWDEIDRTECVKEVAKAEGSDDLLKKYKHDVDAGESLYNSFFEVNTSLNGKNVKWTKANPKIMSFAFLQPTNAAIATYLKSNVEDEWKVPGWNLQIEFQTKKRKNIPQLEFVAGATAHADMNKIIMDENEPISEYSSQWVIRHEFGHLLGFRDCYVEFYDEEAKAIVNYQLDITDIMCSGVGTVKPSHYERLKKAYYKD
jgi:hypothetical protein